VIWAYSPLKNFFQTQVSKKYESRLSDEGVEGLAYMKQYFGKNAWIYNVRKWFSFHYERQQIINQLEQMPENEALEIFLSETKGNSLYFASSMLYSRGIAATINAGDMKKGFSTYLSETSEVAGKAIVFLNEMVSEIGKEYLVSQPEEQAMPEPPSAGEIHVPFFINR